MSRAQSRPIRDGRGRHPGNDRRCLPYCERDGLGRGGVVGRIRRSEGDAEGVRPGSRNRARYRTIDERAGDGRGRIQLGRAQGGSSGDSCRGNPRNYWYGLGDGESAGC